VRHNLEEDGGGKSRGSCKSLDFSLSDSCIFIYDKPSRYIASYIRTHPVCAYMKRGSRKESVPGNLINLILFSSQAANHVERERDIV
jgi:hypothetical protein